jgi:hypothetical protein
MHDPEKSDSGIVAAKPTNKAGRPAAEPVEHPSLLCIPQNCDAVKARGARKSLEFVARVDGRRQRIRVCAPLLRACRLG